MKQALIQNIKNLRTQFANLHPRTQQMSVVVGVCLVLLVGFVVLVSRTRPKAQSKPTQAKQTRKISLVSGGSSYAREEVWANRMAHKAKSMESTNAAMAKRLDVMSKQMELLQKALTALNIKDKATKAAPTQSSTTSQALPVQPGSGGAASTSNAEEVIQAPNPGLALLTSPKDASEEVPIQSVDTWIPAGAHLRGVLTSGVVASTATGAASNPQPVIIRLSDHGQAPGGWRLHLKDAHILAACHGDLASERVYCRLDKISYTELSGEVVEKPMEGWVVGNDGKYGLRGTVVDRADQQILSSLFAGMIGSISSYMQAQSSKGVFPVSPFGQSNAMSDKDMLKGAGATGAGNAMDRLAKYLIERAESISPVIVINSGGVVDIAIKTKVDLSESSRLMREVKPASDRLRGDLAHTHAQIRIQTLQEESTQ